MSLIPSSRIVQLHCTTGVASIPLLGMPNDPFFGTNTVNLVGVDANESS